MGGWIIFAFFSGTLGDAFLRTRRLDGPGVADVVCTNVAGVVIAVSPTFGTRVWRGIRGVWG